MKCLLFLVTFGIYLATLSPTISTGDSGELCACSVILGIVHSPGYPLYCLIGKIFTVIFPLANLAYRINLLSSVFAALTVLVLYSIIERLISADFNTALVGKVQMDIDVRKISAIFSAAILLFTKSFWKAAVQAEVFSLNAFFAVLIICFIYKALTEIHKVKFIYITAFLFGLAFTNHHTILFLIPGFLLVIFKLRKFISIYQFVNLALLFLLGFSVYIYLPIRSVKNPQLDWSNPETLNRTIRVITRKDYGTFALTVGEAQKRTFNIMLKQVIRYLSELKSEMTIFAMSFTLLSWLIFFKKGGVFAIVNFSLFILSGIGFLIIGNLPFDPLSDGILERFYVLPSIPLCLSAGYIIPFIAESFKKKKLISPILISIIFAFIPVLVAFNSFQYSNWREYFLVYDYGKNILRTLKPNSIFFMDGGDDTFYSTAYLCFAEKRRRDVELHDRGGLVFKNIYGADFRSLSRDEKEVRRKKIEQKYVDSNIPVFYSTFNKDILAPETKLYTNGILYEAIKTELKIPDIKFDSWVLYSLLRGAYNTYSDYRSQALAPVYVFMHSMIFTEPLPWWNYAYSRWSNVIWLKANLKTELHNNAYKAFNNGNLLLAQQYYKNILEIDSKDFYAILNLGVIAERTNKIEEAKKIYNELIYIKPDYPEVYYNLGVIYWKEENWQKVIECFRKVLELNPEHQGARRYLPQAIARLKK